MKKLRLSKTKGLVSGESSGVAVYVDMIPLGSRFILPLTSNL